MPIEANGPIYDPDETFKLAIVSCWNCGSRLDTTYYCVHCRYRFGMKLFNAEVLNGTTDQH